MTPVTPHWYRLEAEARKIAGKIAEQRRMLTHDECRTVLDYIAVREEHDA